MTTQLRRITSLAIRSGRQCYNASSYTALRPTSGTTACLLVHARNDAVARNGPAQVRQLWGFGSFGKKKKEQSDLMLPNIEELLRKKPKAPGEDGEKPKINLKRASLAKTSIWETEGGEQPEAEEGVAVEKEGKAAAAKAPARRREKQAIPEIPGTPIDPDVILRKARLRMVKRRGVLTRKQKIAQSEKSHLAKSHFFKTSVKKLGPLARQISGKNIAEAKVQMRFSKKKAAQEVLKHLKQAEAEAAVTRDFDLKKTYIDQAWVGRGTPDKELERRAMGRINVLTKPYTSITVVLKEEKTRERIAHEKEAKRWRKKPWVQLPSRPITGQHQYYTW